MLLLFTYWPNAMGNGNIQWFLWIRQDLWPVQNCGYRATLCAGVKEICPAFTVAEHYSSWKPRLAFKYLYSFIQSLLFPSMVWDYLSARGAHNPGARSSRRRTFVNLEVSSLQNDPETWYTEAFSLEFKSSTARKQIGVSLHLISKSETIIAA